MQAKILAVIAPERFNDTELFVPQTVLTNKGHHLTIASTKLGNCVGMYAGIAQATVVISMVDAAQFEALIVVGGYGAVEFLWENAELHQLVNDFHKMGKVVSAICVSPMVLAKAGVLTGKKATVWTLGMSENIALFEACGALYTGETVTVEAAGKLITANSPESADAFAQAIHTAVEQVQSALY